MAEEMCRLELVGGGFNAEGTEEERRQECLCHRVWEFGWPAGSRRYRGNLAGLGFIEGA
jgi:hypothetical protein